MTAQISEWLILDGERVPMDFCPPLPDRSNLVRPWLVSATPPLPLRPGRAADDEDTFLEDLCAEYREVWIDADGHAQSEFHDIFVNSTACWRGYIATWQIDAGLFYFVDIEGAFRPSRKERLFADWFTGVLRIKFGIELCYVHMGFGTVREFETHIAIEAGYEMGRRTIDNRGKKHDWDQLARRNFPGRENYFPGDTEI